MLKAGNLAQTKAVSSRLWVHYHQKNGPQFTMHCRPAVSWTWSGHCDYEKNLYPLPEIKMWFCDHPAHIVVTALTEPADILKGAWKAYIWSHDKHRLMKSMKHSMIFLRFIFLTFVMLMVGNMFWNMEAISFMWSPSPLKLFSTISGAFWCSFSNTNCFFIAETTPRIRE